MICNANLIRTYLWGYLKDKVYINKPQTIKALRKDIRRNIEDIF